MAAQAVWNTLEDLFEKAHRTLHTALARLDDLIAPETRQYIYDSIRRFTLNRPLLTAFVVLNAIFAAVPLLLFAVYAATIGIFFGVWFLVGLVMLGTTLLVTALFAGLAWLWVAGAYLTIKSIAQRFILPNMDARQAQRCAPLSYTAEKEQPRPRSSADSVKSKETSPGRCATHDKPVKTRDITTPDAARRSTNGSVNGHANGNGNGMTNGSASSSPQASPRQAGTYGAGGHEGSDVERERMRRDIARSLK